MTEQPEIMRLMTIAENTIKAAIGDDCYIDDERWGDDRFSIPVFECDEPPVTKCRSTFFFCINKLCTKSAEDQLKEALDYFIRYKL